MKEMINGKEKVKRTFKSSTSRNGSRSIGIIVIVICIVAVLNLIVGRLPENIRNLDISDNKIYEITDTSREMLRNLDQEISFKVFAEKDQTDERITTFLEKYTSLSDKIDVEWIDPILHPSELTGNNVDSNTILISCEETGKSTTVSFDEIIVIDEYSYYMTGSATESEFDGEGQFTSAINYVTSDATKKIYYTSGHGESTFSASVYELLEKNNMTEEERNLLMTNEIPEDCDLLFLYAPVKDISEDEKTLLSDYMEKGGKIFIILGESEGEMPNLNAFLAQYGIEPEEGYIADMQRNYQGNYYYIFPEISGSQELLDGMSSDMVLLVNAHGIHVADPARDTITVTSFMNTSSNAYAVTEEEQKEGTFSLGAVATEEVTDGTSSDAAGAESRLTVMSSESLIDAQITDAFSTLENLTLFMNAVSANFDDVENVAIESKTLEVTLNTMQHAGMISILVIFVMPFVILVCGFVHWWKRRKA